jgi:hypothetical protein
LTKHLGHPLVRNAAGAEPGGVPRTEVVNPKIGKLRTFQGLVPDGLERFLVPRLFLSLGNK